MEGKKILFDPERAKKKPKQKSIELIIVDVQKECKTCSKNLKKIVLDLTQTETLRFSNEFIAELSARYGQGGSLQKVKLSYRQCADLNQLLNLLIVHHQDLYKDPNLLGNYKFTFKCTDLALAMDREAKLYSVSRRIQRLLQKLEQLNLVTVTMDQQISVIFSKELGSLWAQYRQHYLTLDHNLSSEYRKLRSGHARLVFLNSCQEVQQYCCQAKQYFIDYAAKFTEIFTHSLNQYSFTHKIRNNLAQWRKRLGSYCRDLLCKPVSEKIITAVSALCFTSGAMEAYQKKVVASQNAKAYRKKNKEADKLSIEAEKAVPVAETCDDLIKAAAPYYR